MTSNLGNSETNNNQNLSTSPRAAPLVYIGPNQTGAGKFGEVVAYNLTVTNSQGVADYIDITYKSEPNGLSVNLFEADGKTLLKDSDSDGDPDTGLLGVSQSVDIAVKVTIPGDKYINEPEKTTVLATTSASPSDPGCEAILTTEVKPFLDITQTANPETIFIQSAETYNLTTKSRITLNVSGGGLPITAGLPLDIVLTLDNSGSMNGQPINDLVTAANNFVDKLTDEDRVAIYCFDGGGWPGFPAWPHLLLDWTFMDAAGKTQAHNMINTLLGNSNYYTPIWDTIHDAIEKASTPLQDHKPLVIAMTDGENTRNNYGLTPPQGPWPLYD
ncbi:MAG: VWA domain-containing protein, partial [Thermoplasmata archaeon]|nr:VWA domain-containing protein [Thermoplasmata archaeon]